MENKKFKFNTNFNYGGFKAKSDWNLFTTNKDKILTVKSEGITKQEVIVAVQNAGFKIEPLN